MLHTYKTVALFTALLLVVLSTSGCYTVLQLQTSTVYHPEYDETEYDETEVWDDWPDPYYYYHPYQYYSYSSWYYTPWTYWCCDPYWTYPTYWRTHTYGRDTYTGGTVSEFTSQRRRGFQTRSQVPRYTTERHVTQVRRSGTEARKSVKTLRKVGMGTAATPVRRTGMSRSVPSTHNTVSRPTSSVSRSGSSVSRSSSKATSTGKTSAPSKRRGSGR